MCGIAGFAGGWGESSRQASLHVLQQMTDSIRARGPDAEGHWLDPERAIAMGHRRLAIQDLSAAGAQPMMSSHGRFVISFNGEIYNHLELRKALEQEGGSSAWRGHSDTETLLAGFEVWGVEATLQRTVGMFAFALWDRLSRLLTLARDRVGEKPLYFGWFGRGVHRTCLFGSELRALRCHPAFASEIDPEAVSGLFRRGVVAGARSIYRSVLKVQPGTMVTVRPDDGTHVETRYWSLAGRVAAAKDVPFAGSAEDAVSELDRMLAQSVRSQRISDVPLGALLSGGVDSTAVVAVLRSVSATPVNTFSIGFDESGFDESRFAADVARRLDTIHTELRVSAAQALGFVDALPGIYDEPFADSSQLPTALVCNLTRGHVTVALTGDAGDELFGGYNRHIMVARLWPSIRSYPQIMRRLAMSAVLTLSPSAWDTLVHWVPGAASLARPGEKLHKAASVIGARDLSHLYEGLTSVWGHPERVLAPGVTAEGRADAWFESIEGLSNAEQVMFSDMMHYLPDDLLVKVDRAAMAASLETRVPFLDHRLMEFAWSLPEKYKVRRQGGLTIGKWVLRQVVERHLPRALVDRPKMGFAMPIERWLRHELRDWAEGLLDTRRIERCGWLDGRVVQETWREHMSGRRDHTQRLWAILMFMAWLDRHHGG